MTATRSIPPLVLLLALSGGCLFDPVVLDLAHAPAAARVGPLSSVAPTRFALAPFSVSRLDPVRIGTTKSGYGGSLSDIRSRAPVGDVVRAAVGATFEKNGHSLADDGPLRIEGDVSEFWVESRTSVLLVEVAGTVACKLAVMDVASGETIYQNTYAGHFAENAGALGPDWTHVMNEALVRFADSIALDDALAEALKMRPRSPASP